MFPFDLNNADLAGYQVFYFLLIVKAVYLIFFNYFQSSVKFRIRLFRVLKFLCFFLFIPLYIFWIFVGTKQYIEHDVQKFLLERVYWKAVTLFMILVIIAIIFFFLNPTLSKGIKFLKKKDRNEVKYQSIFKKTRTYFILLMFIDIAMVLFLNRIAN